MSERKAIIKARPEISITRPCQLLAVPRLSAYTRPQHVAEVDVELMRQIDELYLNGRSMAVGACVMSFSVKDIG